MRLFLFSLLISALGLAQAPASEKLDLNFPNLAAKASDKSELDLDGAALGLARQMAGQGAAQGALAGVTGIFVRHYEFAQAGAYSDADLAPLRKQIASNSAWSRILGVKDKEQNVEIFMLAPAAAAKTDADSAGAGGFLLIAAEPTEVNVVQIQGTVELDRLRELVKSSISYDLKGAIGGK